MRLITQYKTSRRTFQTRASNRLRALFTELTRSLLLGDKSCATLESFGDRKKEKRRFHVGLLEPRLPLLTVLSCDISNGKRLTYRFLGGGSRHEKNTAALLERKRNGGLGSEASSANKPFNARTIVAVYCGAVKVPASEALSAARRKKRGPPSVNKPSAFPIKGNKRSPAVRSIECEIKRAVPRVRSSSSRKLKHIYIYRAKEAVPAG